jgi:hypothetical protein
VVSRKVPSAIEIPEVGQATGVPSVPAEGDQLTVAAGCMATRYGEARLFTFVRLVLTQDNGYDQAARDAYGVPFGTVDRACVAWIRQRAS